MGSTKASRSAFFFLGRLDPPELANFQLQNVPLGDRGAVLEILGHAISIWWPSRLRREFGDLLDAARAWVVTIASAYYLETGTALEATLIGWVEALDVFAREAVIGTIDVRFHKVKAVAADDPVNEPMRRAVALAGRLRGAGELERAANQLLAAANDPTVQALLSAYRALECVRRIYEPKWANRARGWKTMRKDLKIRHQLPPEVLADAAEAIRHGDIPLRSAARHPVNKARRGREELLGRCRAIVAQAVERHT